MTMEQPPEDVQAFISAQQAGIRPAQPKPDVPIGPVLTNYRFVPMRDPATGTPVVCLRFATPMGPLHFIFPAAMVHAQMADHLRDAALAAELLPDLPKAGPTNNGGGLYVPDRN